MAKYARFVDGVVFETFTPPDSRPITAFFSASMGFEACPDSVNQGWTYANGVWSAPLPPPPLTPLVPDVLSRVQFFTQAVLSGIISQDDAQAAVVGGIPTPFANFVATLPTEQQFPARMALAGATEFRRANPLVAKFAAFSAMTTDQVNAFFTQGALL